MTTKVRWWLTVKDFHPKCHIEVWTLEECGHVRLRDKLKTFNLHCHNAYFRKNSQGGEIPLWASTHSHMTFYLRYYIFTFTRLMSTKLGRVLTSRSTFEMQTPKLTPTFGFPFPLLISCRYVWTTWQKFFVYFLSFITVEMCCQYRIHFIGNNS